MLTSLQQFRGGTSDHLPPCRISLLANVRGSRLRGAPALRATGDRGTTGKGASSKGGYTCEYTWTQTERDVFIVVPVADGLKAKDINYELQSTRLSLTLPEGTVFDKEELMNPVVVDDSFWEMDEEKGRKVLRVQLAKVPALSRQASDLKIH